MRKRDLVKSTVAVTAMMILASVGYSTTSNVNTVVQQVYAAEIENSNQSDINDVVGKVVSNSSIESEPEPTPDIQWTRRGGISVIQGTVLTEAILQLPSNIHLNDVPYVCDIVGSFDIRLIAVDDTNNTAGELLYQINVFPAQTQAPTATPTQTPSQTSSPTPSTSSTPVSNNSVDTGTSSSDYTENDVQSQEEIAQPTKTVSKTVEIACGQKLTLESMGFDTYFPQVVGGTSYSYEYDECFVGDRYDSVTSFDTEVVEINNTTGERTVYTVTVKVVDKTAPTLKGVKSTIKIVGGKNVVARIKKGVSAKDNIDGTIAKSRIKISGYKAKKYDKYQKVTFTVKDKAGNTTTKTVKLKITNPVKKLSKTMYVKASTLNVRSSSSAKGKKLGTLKFCNKIKVIGQDRNTGWYKIKYKDKTGWVNKSYVSTKKPSKPVSKKKTSGKIVDGVYVASDCYTKFCINVDCDGERECF